MTQWFNGYVLRGVIYYFNGVQQLLQKKYYNWVIDSKAMCLGLGVCVWCVWWAYELSIYTGDYMNESNMLKPRN